MINNKNYGAIMKVIFAAAMLIILGGCYTEIQKRERTPGSEVPISDTNVFLPDSNYSSADLYIEDIYGKWINSMEEQTSIIKVYRRENYPGFSPVRFRHEIYFDASGACTYLIIHNGDIPEYLKYRWRLLKDDPNIIYLYNSEGRLGQSLRIESLEADMFTFIWLK